MDVRLTEGLALAVLPGRPWMDTSATRSFCCRSIRALAARPNLTFVRPVLLGTALLYWANEVHGCLVCEGNKGWRSLVFDLCFEDDAAA